MLTIKINQIKNDDLFQIINYLLDEKIIAYPTDTIYGLGCIATSQKAIDKIYAIKKRKKDKPLLVLVKSYCMLKKYFFVSAKQDKLLRTLWIRGKAPTTVILKQRGLLANNLAPDNFGVAVRMPINNSFVINLIKKINLPIIATSLNISGESPIEKINQIDDEMSKKIDLAVDAGLLDKKSSTLIDIQDINNIITLRK
ncbi:MAG: L-threonylcarbamoyladenylate synthase [Candidatus Falkowbacteria bacterium]|nr:L-threonylcarbamoyladenylate synthase [Candidatus Falkowbacteria bacterium]